MAAAAATHGGCFGCEAAPNVGRQRPVLLHEREERQRQRHARDADHDQHISSHGADLHHSAVAQACDGRHTTSRAERRAKLRRERRRSDGRATKQTWWAG